MATVSESYTLCDSPLVKLPDHLLVEIFIRLPVSDWSKVSCVKKHWAELFKGEYMWQAALMNTYPSSGLAKRWPGPIPQGLSKRRYTALHVSRHIFALNDEMDEIVGHSYLFLKEQLEVSNTPPPSNIIHGTIIDQFITCGSSRDRAHEFASLIWLGVIDNLEENEKTYKLLKRLALEESVFLPFPYSISNQVMWKIFEKIFTDFHDCLNRVDFCDLLSSAKSRFQLVPATWSGY